MMRLFTAVIVLLVLAACLPQAALPPLPAVAPPLRLERIALVDTDSPIAATPAGDLIAFSATGLQLLNRSGKSRQQLTEATAQSLTFNRNGNRLGAAFAVADGSRVEVFTETDQWQSMAAAELDGSVSSLQWRDETTLTIATVQLIDYSFGSNCRTVLYSWRPPQQPQQVTAYDTTLKPATRNQPEFSARRLVRHTLSPAGDEALLLHLHAPPAFDAYRIVELRQLDSGEGREIARIPLTRGTATFAPEETIIVDDATSLRRFDPWTERQLQQWVSGGGNLALSADGRYLLTGNQLYDGARLLATLPADSEGIFTHAGLLLRHQRQLLWLHGLQLSAPSKSDETPLIRLRNWRSRGLIDHHDYLRLKEANR